MSPQDAFEALRDLVVTQFGMAADKITPDTKFQTDLGGDEVDLESFVVEAESVLDISLPDERLESLGENFSLGELADLALRQNAAPELS